jgi:hypothetical protein
MLRRSFVQMSVCICLIGAFGAVQTATAKPPAKKDPDGWIWRYTATKGNRTESGTFRVLHHEVFRGQKKIGHVVPEGGTALGDKTTLILDDFDDMSGTAVLTKIRKKPLTWAGKLQKEGGAEWKLSVVLAEK